MHVAAPITRETHHGWKFIHFGPDGMLYVPVGATCNICERDPDRYALISRIKPDGSGYEVFAPDGSLLVSDDYAGAVYRISYAK